MKRKKKLTVLFVESFYVREGLFSSRDEPGSSLLDSSLVLGLFVKPFVVGRVPSAGAGGENSAGLPLKQKKIKSEKKLA